MTKSQDNLIGGAGEREVKNNSYEPLIGLATVTPIIANPTRDQYIEITGNDKMPEKMFDYAPYEGYDNLTMTPIKILCRITEDKYDFMNFSLSDTPVTSRNGKMEFINDRGQISFYADNAEVVKNNDKVSSWYSTKDMTPARVGEKALMSFMQIFCRYDAKFENGSWKADVLNIKADFDTLVKGNVEGLNTFMKHYVDKDFKFVTMLSIREYSNSEGEVRTAQSIESGINTLFPACYDDSLGEFIIPKSYESAVKAREAEVASFGGKLCGKRLYNTGLAINYSDYQSKQEESTPLDTMVYNDNIEDFV